MPQERRYRRVRRQYTDDTTGEVRDLSHEEEIVSRRPPDKRENENFSLLFVNAIPDLLAMGLQGNDLRVFLTLVRDMEFDNPWRPYYTGLAESIGMNPVTFARSMTRLKAEGAVFEVPNREILLNPTIVWRGTKAVRWEWVIALRRENRLPQNTIPIEGDTP